MWFWLFFNAEQWVLGGFRKQRVWENLFYAWSTILFDKVIIVELAAEREVLRMFEVPWQYLATKQVLVFDQKAGVVVIWFWAPAHYVVCVFFGHKIVKVDDKRWSYLETSWFNLLTLKRIILRIIIFLRFYLTYFQKGTVLVTFIEVVVIIFSNRF